MKQIPPLHNFLIKMKNLINALQFQGEQLTNIKYNLKYFSVIFSVFRALSINIV